MIPLIETKRSGIEDLCRRFHVARLEVFGSAAEGTFDPSRSDLDFLVEFRRTPEMTAADQYFGALEALTNLFNRKVDLVEIGALQNSYFIKRVNETRKLLYAA
ncbi:MAG: nucleotidyltransferase domain-containing protein [Planctomycetota bacterium]